MYEYHSYRGNFLEKSLTSEVDQIDIYKIQLPLTDWSLRKLKSTRLIYFCVEVHYGGWTYLVMLRWTSFLI